MHENPLFICIHVFQYKFNGLAWPGHSQWQYHCAAKHLHQSLSFAQHRLVWLNSAVRLQRSCDLNHRSDSSQFTCLISFAEFTWSSGHFRVTRTITHFKFHFIRVSTASHCGHIVLVRIMAVTQFKHRIRYSIIEIETMQQPTKLIIFYVFLNLQFGGALMVWSVVFRFICIEPNVAWANDCVNENIIHNGNFYEKLNYQMNMRASQKHFNCSGTSWKLESSWVNWVRERKWIEVNLYRKIIGTTNTISKLKWTIVS